jgi:hypothetical protein
MAELLYHIPLSSRFIYRTIIVLYGYATGFLTLSERHDFWVFKNRALRTVLGAKREDVTVS